jgi:hypothetical protein
MSRHIIALLVTLSKNLTSRHSLIRQIYGSNVLLVSRNFRYDNIGFHLGFKTHSGSLLVILELSAPLSSNNKRSKIFQIFNLKRRPPLLPRKIPGTHIC